MVERDMMMTAHYWSCERPNSGTNFEKYMRAIAIWLSLRSAAVRSSANCHRRCDSDSPPPEDIVVGGVRNSNEFDSHQNHQILIDDDVLTSFTHHTCPT